MTARPLYAAASALAAIALGSTLLSATPPAIDPLATASPDADTLKVATAAAGGGSAAASAAPKAGLGFSGTVRVAVVRALDALNLPFIEKEQTAEGTAYRWVPMFGTRDEQLPGDAPLRYGLRAPAREGIWNLLLRGNAADRQVGEVSVITEVPFAAKQGGYLNGYHIGRYPTESDARTDRYAPPAGFIEVTLLNRDLPISEHFRLGQFVTKDQSNVWPKYVALDMRLIDKLELVLQELNAMGVRAERMHVMSGFRTPQYNGPGENGRAKLSRHTYGDAADVWVDNDGNGYIDDLNGDGRSDFEDIKIMLRAVDRVEQRYPDLIGGAGVYIATESHGPFIHIDVRGERSRW